MAQVALKVEFEKFFVDAPSAPALPIVHANDNGFDIARAFQKACDKFQRDAIIWRSKMIADIDNLEATLSRQALSPLVRKRDVIPALEDTLARADSLLQDVIVGTPEMNAFWETLSVLGQGNSEWRTPAKKMRKNYLQMRETSFKTMKAVKDRLQQVVWKFDPDSEGGEAFENAEDAIAFLRG